MIEIIPNWHPFFVHFTVALLLTASALQVMVLVLGERPLTQTWRLVAKWNLWLGAGFAVLTLISGIIAFNSVTHDDPAHLAMLEHRSWALVTAAVFLVIACWVAVRHRQEKPIDATITGAMVIGAVLLLSTAWHGGELVYRHGLGVMSLPDLSDHAHSGDAAHEHDDHPHDDATASPATATDSEAHPHTDDHAHDDDDVKPEIGAPSESSLSGSEAGSDEKVHVHADGSEHKH